MVPAPGRPCCEVGVGRLQFSMESKVKGPEVMVSGKLQGQRAEFMKFVDDLLIHSGDPENYYVELLYAVGCSDRVCWASK